MDNKDISGHFNKHADAGNSSGLYIETPRLILREIEPSDRSLFQGIISKPELFGFCFEGTPDKDGKPAYRYFDGTAEILDEFMATSVRTRTPDPATGMRDMYMLAVTTKDDNTLIGHASLERVSYIKGIDYEPNYFIDPDHQGKGYGPEAMINVIHFAFNKLALPALTSTQPVGNIKAIEIAQNVYGFKKAGDVMISTTQGPEPYMLNVLSPDDFYALRKLDKRPYILTPHGGTSNSPQPSP